MFTRYSIVSFTVFLLSAFQVSTAQQAWASKYLKVENEKLVYIPDEQGNTLPDFSQVGCYQNKRALPEVGVVKTLSAVEGDCQALIQSAIEEVGSLPLGDDGFRGAILLKAGVYRIAGTLEIKTDGIVIRGEGPETRLIATGKGKRSLVSFSGSGQLREIPDTRTPIREARVAAGAMSVMVETAFDLQAGDSVVVFRPGTQNWIDDLKMTQIAISDSNTKQWTPREYDLHFERVITAVKGRRIFLDNPVVMPMEKKYGGGAIYKYQFMGRLSNVGIEHLTCESEYQGEADEDHAWDAVKMNQVQNGWVRQVTSKYFGNACVNLTQLSRNITVTGCRCISPKSIITGGRRYSFNNDGQMNLFMDCFASEGRHDYVTGSKVRGPNVFYNCRSENAQSDIGPHHRWSSGTLFDNIVTDGEINIQDRGNWGSGHGWAGVTQVLWNCTARKVAVQNPWVTGKNYAIGITGNKYDGRLKGRPDGEWEGLNTTGLSPVSLYQAQLTQSAGNRRK